MFIQHDTRIANFYSSNIPIADRIKDKKRSYYPFTYIITPISNSHIRRKYEKNSNFEMIFGNLIKQCHCIKDNRIKPIISELNRTKSMIGFLIGQYWEDSLYEKLDAKGRYEHIIITIKSFLKAQSLKNQLL
jgi:hypothetical protein